MEARYLFETDEHQALRAQVRKFAREHIAPHSLAWDEAEAFPEDLYRAAARAGITGIGYPEAYGGSGGDFSHLIVAADEMVVSGHSVGTAVGLGSHAIALPPILKLGTEEQKQRFVRPVLEGTAISALAITEPSGGSDVASLTTRARRDGDVYIVDGAKTFITSGCRAHFVTAAVRTGGPKHAGVSMLVIERTSPGFIVSKKLQKTGWRASDTAELAFDGCRVPAGNLIGGENEGFLAIMSNFMGERVMLAAQCVAIAQLCYDQSVKYAKERRAFDKTLTGFQVTRHKLADMATRLAAVRAITNEAVVRMVRGENAPGVAAMAKNAATDMLMAVAYEATQIHGGYGYMRETLVERLWRDARLYPIGGGTREVMNEIISKIEGY
jgi:acyl-CoA dehydrogenase